MSKAKVHQVDDDVYIIRTSLPPIHVVVAHEHSCTSSMASKALNHESRPNVQEDEDSCFAFLISFYVCFL